MDKFLIIFIIVSLALAFGCRNPNKEWRPLYNGRDLKGWIIKGKPDDLNRKYWRSYPDYIEANSLEYPDHDYVWLVSADEYVDFELKFKFQAFKNSPGNSGIQLHSRYVDELYWLDGPQIDIHPPEPWRTGMMWDETRGNQRWIFPELEGEDWVDPSMALSKAEFYYAGDSAGWNEMLVQVNGSVIKAWLNESLITDYDGNGIINDSLHMARQVGISGHIAFQIHSGDALKIRYKDIFIRELP